MLKHKIESERPVTRVLVMLQYDEQTPSEVFDLTTLSREVAQRAEQHHDCCIELSVHARQDYSKGSPYPLKTEAHWLVRADFHSSSNAAYLDDAINASLPDSLATQDLKKKLAHVQAKAEQLARDIQVQRLFDASQIRAQHPIARVKEAPALADVASATTPIPNPPVNPV